MFACLRVHSRKCFNDVGIRGGPNQIDTKGTISGVISSMKVYSFIDGRVIQSVWKIHYQTNSRISYLNLFIHLDMVSLKVEIYCIECSNAYQLRSTYTSRNHYGAISISVGKRRARSFGSTILKWRENFIGL